MRRKTMAGVAGVVAIAAIGIVSRKGPGEPCASPGACVLPDGGVVVCLETRSGPTTLRNCERVTCVAPPDTEPCEPQP